MYIMKSKRQIQERIVDWENVTDFEFVSKTEIESIILELKWILE